ncbi:MAG TPA: DivIVA domain-containing protein [Micromonosporaceae bacterium]
MGHLLLLLLGALVVGAVAYGVTWIVTGRDLGLDPEEPDGRGVPLPTTRPLTETDIETVRFDTTLRGYRMDQVDAALRRAAYDLGYKEELIEVLEAEIEAIRAGHTEEAEQLRASREGAQPTGRPAVGSSPATAEPPKNEADDWRIVDEADDDDDESEEAPATSDAAASGR